MPYTEILDFYLFRTLNEVREITEKWLSEYNCERPHESLNNMTPEEYRKCMELKRVYLQKDRKLQFRLALFTGGRSLLSSSGDHL
ncbi:hypothetical protein R523_22505 [Salmonella enterica subsp. enterica serovar Holcomb]|nr:hypothetical protein R535_21610 [Salmonella enterica subsp. enterica serovar Holcomb]OSE01854.1 hypothetical protein R523_22505 [Salmonella enterica subsp. enterica serovar Holcomb]